MLSVPYKDPATIPGTKEFEFYKGKTLNADKKSCVRQNLKSLGKSVRFMSKNNI